LLLKLGIAHRKHFVYDQNLRFQMGCHGKGQPHLHATAVVLDRCVQEFFNTAEIDNRVKLLANLRTSHTQDCTVEKNILPTGKLRVKASTHFQQRRHASVDLKTASTRIRNARQDLQQRAFPRTIPTNDAYRLALPDLERNILQRPELLACPCRGTSHKLTQPLRKRSTKITFKPVTDHELFSKIFDS